MEFLVAVAKEDFGSEPTELGRLHVALEEEDVLLALLEVHGLGDGDESPEGDDDEAVLPGLGPDVQGLLVVVVGQLVVAVDFAVHAHRGVEAGQSGAVD